MVEGIAVNIEGARHEGAEASAWRIFCLGQFRVYRGQEEIKEWCHGKGPAQKVKAMFAYLLAKGEEGASKWELLDLLWPHQRDMRRANNSFHAALYSLRRALEPELHCGERASYIIYQEGRCKFVPSGSCWVDADAFEEHYRQGQRLERLGQRKAALLQYKMAEELYKGDYMAGISPKYTEDCADDWCRWRRFKLKDMYLTVLLKLARYYEERGQGEECLAYTRKALAQDGCCEEAHRMMMRAFYRAGQREDLIRQYRLCQRILRRREDREPSAETVALYKRLLAASRQTLKQS